MGKITTSIPKLDELLKGGIEGRGSVLILTDPMVDKATFAQQIVSHRIQEGDGAVYLTTTKLPEHIIDNMRQRSWKTEGISWVDCISHALQKKPASRYALGEKASGGSFAPAKDLWKKALGDVGKPSIAVFDCLETFMDVGGGSIAEMIRSTKAFLEKNNIAAVYLLTDWGYPMEEIDAIKNATDVRINLGTLEKKSLWLNYFTTDTIPKIFFKTTITGVNLYVPKILVTGDYHAGKSSTVKALSERSVSVDRLGTTVALDHGYVERGGMVVDIFGTPGQERFDWILKILSKDTWGIILVVDSTRPQTFPRAKKMLDVINVYKIPTIVFANKQDMEGALRPAEVGKKLGIKSVVGTVATDGGNCQDGLKMLFDEILRAQGP